MTSLWARIVRSRRLDRHLDAEIADHLERQVRDLVSGGLSEAEAEQVARRAFGGVGQVKDACRDVRGARLLPELLADIRFGARLLRRAPGVAIATIAVLALGIGAATAIFSLVETALLRRVPVRDSEQIHFIAHRVGEATRMASNYPYLERLRAASQVFSGVTAFTLTSFKVSTGQEMDRVRGEYVAGNYYGLLGVPFSLGRGFAAEADDAVSEARLAVISHGYWLRRFGARPDVLGTTILVDGRALAIVGVTARGFNGFVPGRPADVTLPLSLKAVEQPGYLTMHDTWTSLTLLARLSPGVDAARGGTAVDTVFRQYLSEPDNRWYKAERGFLVAADRGSDAVRRVYQTSLGVLVAMVAVVLLVACANVASLLLARGSGRVKEIAVRLSMGASRWRIVRQLLAESVWLAVAGGLLGYLLGRWIVGVLTSILDTGPTAIVLDVAPNTTVAAFAVLVSLSTVLLCAAAPAVRASRVNLTPALKVGGEGDRGHRHWTARRGLVALQIALCVLTVSGAGLLLRTLRNLQAPNVALDSSHVQLFTFESRAEAPLDGAHLVCAAWLRQLDAFPEIASASCGTSSPIDQSDSRRGAIVDSVPVEGGVFASVVSPDYFRTFSIPVLRGRAFQGGDTPGGQKVGIVNERLARLVFGQRNPIGRTFVFRSEPGAPIEIVGIVRDVPQHSLREGAPPTVYTPLGQGGEVERFPELAIRSARDHARIVSMVQDAARMASPDFSVIGVRTLEDQLDAALVRERVLAILSSSFGALTLGLACVGLYAVMAHDVTRRRRELGIRLSLGARPAQVLAQVLRESASLTLVGLAAGVALTLVSTRWLSSQLFGLTSRDPLTMAGAVGILAATTFAAAYIPARRAARVDPARALRSE